MNWKLLVVLGAMVVAGCTGQSGIATGDGADAMGGSGADGSGVQARTLQRLRRGRLRPEATLDLHGFTRHEAHLEVDRFLRRAHADGCRCVLIIHGIGRGSESHGVLREALPGWLAAHPEVLSSAPAQPADGGAGASYILLRRAAPVR